MSELFPPEDVQSLSPRLQWMQRHGVSVRLNQYAADAPEPWEAWTWDYSSAVADVAEFGLEATTRIAYGATEIDAIVNLAKANGWKLWNEVSAE